MSKLLLINKNLVNYENFIVSKLDDVLYIVIDEKESSYSFREKLKTINLSDVTNIGLLFKNTGNRSPFFEYTQDELDILNNVVCITPENVSSIPQNSLEHAHLLNMEGSSVCYADSDGNMYDTVEPVFVTKGVFFSNTFLTELENLKISCPNFNTLDIISCNISDTFITKDEYVFLNRLGLRLNYSTEIIGVYNNITNWTLNRAYRDNVYNDINLSIINIYFTNLLAYNDKLGIGTIPANLIAPSDLFDLMNTTNTADLARSYTLVNNIDMTGYTAQSIGKSTANFKGSFNGAGYTITINAVNTSSTQSATYYGLFGYVTGTAPSTYVNIQNLNVLYTTTTIGNTTGNYTKYFGGLIGLSTYVTVNNCNVTFANSVTIQYGITSAGTSISTYIGGLIGQGTTRSIIQNSTVTFLNDVLMRATCQSQVIGYPIVGGIIGMLRTDSSLINCNALCYGNTTLISESLTEIINSNIFFSLVGGIVGSTNVNNSSTQNIIINNCTTKFMSTTKSVIFQGTSTSKSVRIGGILGAAYGTNNSITNNYIEFNGPTQVIQTVASLLTASYYIMYGAICGVIGSISSQINSCNVTFNNTFTYNGTSLNSQNTIGNLFGYISTTGDTISSCTVTYTKQVNLTMTLTNNVIQAINGSSYFGGLIGYISGATFTTVNNLNINCLQDLNITSNTFVTQTVIGGLIAGLQAGIVSLCSCNYYGNVTITLNSGGDNWTGLYIGSIFNSLTVQPQLVNNIITHYSKVFINSLSNSANIYMGLLFGAVYSTNPNILNNSVYLNDTTQLTINNQSSSRYVNSKIGLNSTSITLPSNNNVYYKSLNLPNLNFL